MFDKILLFEKKLSEFTGAPYVVTTDCCTHALELCFIVDNIKQTSFTAYTYLSVVQLMYKLNIDYTLDDEYWIGEYNFKDTRIWDSARNLKPNMYIHNQLQCLSFGYSKPLDIGRGGAILTDDFELYKKLSMLRYDGRDISISPWESQKEFNIGYHYKLNPEECIRGIEKLEQYKLKNDFTNKFVKYPDCRKINIV